MGGSARITVSEGNVRLRIHGQVNQDVHWGVPTANRSADERPKQPIVRGGTITRDETKHLFAGDEISFRIIPSEVVIVNIVSLDGTDAEITSWQPRTGERKHTLPGANRMGITLAFQSR